MLPSSYFQITRFPDIKLSTFSADNNINNVFRVTVEEPAIFPKKLISFSKSKKQTRLDVSLPVILATSSTIEQSRLFLFSWFFERKFRTYKQPPKTLWLSRTKNYTTIFEYPLHSVPLKVVESVSNSPTGELSTRVIGLSKHNTVLILIWFPFWREHF